jgi:3-methylcrotonyl-CoA carboxylase beta subunit
MASKVPSREALTLLKHSIRPAVALRSQAQSRLLPSAAASLRTQAPTHPSRQTTRSTATFTHSHHADAVSVLPTLVDTNSADFKENKRDMEEVTEKLNSLHSKIALGGPQKARDKHLQRGKMLVRDRITALIDPGTPFLELSQMAGHHVYPGEDTPAAGILTGIGTVNGVQCMVVANDSTVKGGTYTRLLSKSTSAPKRSRRKTDCRASTSSTLAVPICLTRPMSSPMSITSAVSFTTRHACLAWASPKSVLSWAPAQLVALIFPV